MARRKKGSSKAVNVPDFGYHGTAGNVSMTPPPHRGKSRSKAVNVPDFGAVTGIGSFTPNGGPAQNMKGAGGPVGHMKGSQGRKRMGYMKTDNY